MIHPRTRSDQRAMREGLPPVFCSSSCAKCTVFVLLASQLRAVAKVLNSRSDVKRLTIEGHTCTDGTLQWNEVLSQERAATVRSFLLDECGVAEARLTTVGYGPHKPLTKEHSQRRSNRRVEFLVL